jgi:hypothetical protein
MPPQAKRRKGAKRSYDDPFGVVEHRMLDAWKYRAMNRSIDMKEPRNVTLLLATLAICYQVFLTSSPRKGLPSIVTRLPKPAGPRHTNKTLFGYVRAEYYNEGRGSEKQLENVKNQIDQGMVSHPLRLMLENEDACKAALLIFTRKLKIDYDDKFCTSTRHYNDDEKLVTSLFRSASTTGDGVCAYLAALKLLDFFANQFHRSTTAGLLAGLGKPAKGMSAEEPSFDATLRGNVATKGYVAFSATAAHQIRDLEKSIIEHFSSQEVSDIVNKALDAAKAGPLTSSVMLPAVPYSRRQGVWGLSVTSREVRPLERLNASVPNRQQPTLSRNVFRRDIRNVVRGADPSFLYQAPYATVQGDDDGEEEDEGEEEGDFRDDHSGAGSEESNEESDDGAGAGTDQANSDC